LKTALKQAELEINSMLLCVIARGLFLSVSDLLIKLLVGYHEGHLACKKITLRWCGIPAQSVLFMEGKPATLTKKNQDNIDYLVPDN